MRTHTLTWLVPGLIAAVCVAARGGEDRPEMDLALDAMPAGYNLQAYDDCGRSERQPHIRCSGIHEYNPGVVDADQAARTVGTYPVRDRA